MKKGSIILGIIATFMMISALPGLAQQYRQPGMTYPNNPNLTPEQIAKIEELTLEFQKDILPMETQLQTLYMELESLSYGNTGEAKFNEVNKKIDTLEMELEKRHMAHENQIRALLTEEQRVIFDQWGELGLGLGRMGGMDLGMGYGRGYAGYGRGYAGYGRGYSGYGRGYAGYGRGYSSYGRGYAGYGRGSSGYGRGYAGMTRGYSQGWGRGMGRGPGMGRGYWCPWYRQGMFSRIRNWQ